MTQAIQHTHLSKLDLFTPSPLHPHLPPLVTAPYPMMDCIMLSTPDVLARAAHIRSLLGPRALDAAYMRVRPATHDRITKHLRIQYEAQKGWVVCPDAKRGDDDALWEELTRTSRQPASMRTGETRRRYAEKALGKEWEALGGRPREDYMACVRGFGRA
jgi:hypothetical protein